MNFNFTNFFIDLFFIVILSILIGYTFMRVLESVKGYNGF